jgi:hypothetical protein
VIALGRGFWPNHREAWQQSALNQREYRDAHGIPLKAFGNWRANSSRTVAARTEPFDRRRGLSPTLVIASDHEAASGAIENSTLRLRTAYREFCAPDDAGSAGGRLRWMI